MNENIKKKFGVYIIESLHWDDEEKNDFDGKILRDSLRLAGIPTKYVYIRSVPELRHS